MTRCLERVTRTATGLGTSRCGQWWKKYRCIKLTLGAPVQVGCSERNQYVCPCSNQSPKCGNNSEPLDKQAAVLILAELLKGR